MRQFEVLQEALDQIANLAIRMEDEPNIKLGKSYSVNINFRRDGQRLYVSIESYGKEHCGKSEEYIIPLLRKRKVHARVLTGCLIGLGMTLVAAFVMALK